MCLIVVVVPTHCKIHSIFVVSRIKCGVKNELHIFSIRPTHQSLICCS